MRKKGIIVVLFVATLLVLSACGGGGGGKVNIGVNEISYKELMKKIENRDSFFLITIESDEKILEESKFLEYYDETLQYYGISAYFVNLKGESEGTIKELSENHLHPFYKERASTPEWNAEGEGIVYVENGGILPLVFVAPYHEKYLSDGRLTESDVEEDVSELLRLLESNGFEYKNE